MQTNEVRDLSGLDAAFVYAETATTPMNVVATIVLEPDSTGPDYALPKAVDYEAVVERLEERLPAIPQFRRLLVEMPFGLDRPVWIETEDIDLQHHVFRVLAREPGDGDELANVVAKAASARLDRSRPLWSMWVVEGLEGDRVALVIRVHHALLDGMSGAALLLHLFDRPSERASESTPRPSVDHTVGEQGSTATETRFPSGVSLLGRAVRAVPGRVRATSAAIEEVSKSVARIVSKSRDESWQRHAPVKPLTAPETRLNRALSNSRSVAYSRIPLRQVKRVKTTFGGTLNNVVLAGCTSSLRNYLRNRGELPETPLVATIPVSTRSATDEPGGNRISAMMVRLPVQVEDPIERYIEVSAEAQLAKRFHGVMGRGMLASIAELASPGLSQRALRLYSQWQLANNHRPLSNVTISTVTGPPCKLRLAGAEVEAIHPHGPLIEGSGLNITVMSYGGSIDVGVLACSQTLPNPREIADGISAEVERLSKLANQSIPELDVLG